MSEKLENLPIYARSSEGIKTYCGPPKLGLIENGLKIPSTSCRNLIFSPQGDLLAYSDASTVSILKSNEKNNDWELVAKIENTKAYHLEFSPKGTYLITWEVYAVRKSMGEEVFENLKIFKTSNGEIAKSFVQKTVQNWQPQFSEDEQLMLRLINNNEIISYDTNFDKTENKLAGMKIANYKLSPNIGQYFLICHIKGSQGQPSLAYLYKYPNYETKLASRSFFQADKMDILWNSKGNNALLLTSTEVDKTDGSYYGKQTLHFIGLNGYSSMVPMSKDGPIYAVEWSPKNQEFCVIYGFMPARMTLFNLKCEVSFEIGSGPMNSIYYNPHGNILLIGGFGNLRGQIQIYDAVNRCKIGECTASDSTLLKWAPNGENFLTATTSPRLRIGNGFKIWHYSGSLLYEENVKELFDVVWQPFSRATFKEPLIQKDSKVAGIKSSQPEASKQVYRPPSARNRPIVNFKLYDDDNDDKDKNSGALSKSAIKNKKKRQSKKANNIKDDDEGKGEIFTNKVEIKLTGDPEHDKKLKNLKKKLDAIEKLKRDQENGKLLEINQLQKIQAEKELLEEFQQLSL